MDSWIYYFIGMIVIVLVFVYITSAIIKSGDESKKFDKSANKCTPPGSLAKQNSYSSQIVLTSIKNENFIEKLYPNEAKTLYSFIHTDYPAESKCQLFCHTVFYHINNDHLEETPEERQNGVLVGFVFWSFAAKTLNTQIKEDLVDFHYTCNFIAEQLYLFRNDISSALEKCLAVCKSDLEILPLLENIIGRAHYPLINRMAIIYEKQGKLQHALEVCKSGSMFEQSAALYRKIEKLTKKVANENVEEIDLGLSYTYDSLTEKLSGGDISLEIEPLEEYAVIHITTSGSSYKKHQLLTIEAIKHTTILGTEYFSAVIKNDSKLNANHIPLEKAMPDFLQFVGRLPVVGYNAKFDVRFLKGKASELGLNYLPKAIYDLAGVVDIEIVNCYSIDNAYSQVIEYG